MRIASLITLAGLSFACATAAPKPKAAEQCTMKETAKVDPAGAVKAFDQKPAIGTKAICPVSGDIFLVDKDTVVKEYNGKFYAFCCESCPNEFHPEQGKPVL